MQVHHHFPHCPGCKKDAFVHKESKEPPPFCPWCRFPLMLLAGKYRLLEEHAQGGFATIYRAVHIGLQHNAERMIKIIKPTAIASSHLEKRFWREVQFTSTLSQNNEHIVRIYDDFGSVPNLGYFYVMEALQGQTLRQRLSSPATLSLEDITHLFRQLCDAVHTAHSAGILHRDLKPENIMLIHQNNDPLYLKVLDFGIGKNIQTHPPSTHLTQGPLGTPLYMSPEQYNHQTINESSDLYAMGVILYELLTGSLPFASEQPERRAPSSSQVQLRPSQEPYPLLPRCHPSLDVPIAIEHVIKQLLSWHPHKRHPSCQALLEAFEQAMNTKENSPATHKSTAKRQKQTPYLRTHEPSTQSQPAPILPNAHTQQTSEQLIDVIPSKKRSAPNTPPDWMLQTHEAQKAPHPSPKDTPPTLTMESQIDKSDAQTDILSSSAQKSDAPPLQSSLKQTSARSPLLWMSIAPGIVVVLGLFSIWFSFRSSTPQPNSKHQPKLSQKTPQKNPPPPKTPTRSAQSTTHTRTQKKPGVAKKRPLPTPPPHRTKRAHASPRKAQQTARRVTGKKRRRSTPKHNTRSLLQRPPGFIRHTPSCPKTPFFWTFLRFEKKQHEQLKPVLSSKDGQIIRQKPGFCVGLKHRNTSLRLGIVAEGWVPCQLEPAKLPPTASIKMEKEGLLDPSSPTYCLKK